MNRSLNIKPMKQKGHLPGKLMGALLITALLTAPGFAFGKDSDEVTRMEFIRLMVKNQKQSQVIPANASALSDSQLYKQVAQNLKKKGFNVLASKNPDKPLSQQEFVRITYAFSDQPAGKSIFEQKLFLKEAGIINTADVGLTTGIQGRAVQFRGEEDSFSPSEMASPVFMQDRVETDLDSMITFTFDDGSTMSMGEDAVVNITEHIYDPERDFRKTIVNVALGAVRFKVTKGKAEGSMFKVITPVATAGVRGTEFVTIVNRGGKTRFVGLEGKVETFARLANGEEGKHEFVVAGTMHDISDTGASSGLQKASAAILEKVFERTNPKNKMAAPPKMTMAKVMKAAKSEFKIGKALGKSNHKSTVPGNAIKGNPGKGNQFAKAAAKEAAKNSAKGASVNAAKGNAKAAAKKAARAAAKQMAQNAIQNQTNQVIQSNANATGGNPSGPPGGVPFGQGGSFPGQGNGPPCGTPPCGQGPGGGGPPGGGPPGP